MNLSTWVSLGGSHTLGEFLAISGAAAPFDAAHVIGNVLFCLAFGPALLRAVDRFRLRSEVTWRDADAPAAPPRRRTPPAPAAAAALGRVVAAVLARRLAGAGARPGRAGAGPLRRARPERRRRLRRRARGRVDPAPDRVGRARPRRRGPQPAGRAARRPHAADLHPERAGRADRHRRAGADHPRPRGGRRLPALLRRPRPRRRPAAPPARRRLRRRDGQLHRVRRPGAARGGAGLLAGGAARGGLAPAPAEPRRRLVLRAARRGQRRRRFQRAAPGARRRRPARRGDRPRPALPAARPERRRRLPARTGRGLQRAVDRVGDPGRDRRRRDRSLRRRGEPVGPGLPALAGRPRTAASGTRA